MKASSLKSYQFPFLCSLVFHMTLFLLIFTQIPRSTSSSPQTSATTSLPSPEPSAPIKAISVDAQAVESEIAKIKKQEAQKAALKQQALKKLQQETIKAKKAQEAMKKIEVAKKKLQQEIQKNKALAEQQKKQALAEQKKAEKARQELAVLKKKQAKEAAELKKQQKAAAELKKQKAADELKKKQLAQTKNKAETQAETSSPNPATNALTDHQRSEMDKYRQLITQSIGQNWIVPDNVDKHLSCELIIKVAPGGAVLSVQLARSSGNSTLDHSAQTAVMKASPLPVPGDEQLFEKFRELSLTVRPEDF